jgi:hypothetical protein
VHRQTPLPGKLSCAALGMTYGSAPCMRCIVVAGLWSGLPGHTACRLVHLWCTWGKTNLPATELRWGEWVG